MFRCIDCGELLSEKDHQLHEERKEKSRTEHVVAPRCAYCLLRLLFNLDDRKAIKS
jgi:DNA-directed RNA polymerase subunit RPC12/RpoP